MNLEFKASFLWLMLSQSDTCHSNVYGLDTATWWIPWQKWTLFKCQYWLVNGIFIVRGWFVKVQHRNRKSILLQQFKFATILIYSYPKYHQTSYIRHEAIIWTNSGILFIGTLRTTLYEILIKIHTFSFKNMHLKMLSGKCWPFFLASNCVNLSWIQNSSTFPWVSYIIKYLISTNPDTEPYALNQISSS